MILISHSPVCGRDLVVSASPRWAALKKLLPQIMPGSTDLVSPRQTVVAACELQLVRDFTSAVQQPVLPERSGFLDFLGREMEDPSYQSWDQTRNHN